MRITSLERQQVGKRAFAWFVSAGLSGSLRSLLIELVFD
jgi:hypothetical protein